MVIVLSVPMVTQALSLAPSAANASDARPEQRAAEREREASVRPRL